MVVFWLVGAAILVQLGNAQLNCGQPACGGGAPYFPTYRPYQQMQQPQPQQQQPATLQYYYPANSYAIAPQQLPQVLAQIDKETSVDTGKSSYEQFEKELDKLKPSVIKSEEENKSNSGNELKASLAVLNSSSTSTIPAVTYIREYSAYAPEAYLPRPLPYRPVPYIPRGCPVVAPQLVRPIPFYPRGYVQPAAPQPLPVVQPQPQPSPAAYVTAPIVRPPTTIYPPPINDCCGKCGAPCKYRSRKSVIALASKIFTAQFVPRRDNETEDEPKDPKCNSERLKDIMNQYITRTVALSKRLIQKNAESELGGYFSVFCATDDFSYVARSETFCQLQKGDIICYAFKHQ